jgi:hypothetical protein
MVTALMFETMSVEICEPVKKTLVTAWVVGAPSKQAHVAIKTLNCLIVFIRFWVWLNLGE